jgi:hypothetical protein
VKVGTSEEQGGTVNLQVAVHPGALAAGPFRRISCVGVLGENVTDRCFVLQVSV